jgi:hypothetical protein
MRPVLRDRQHPALEIKKRSGDSDWLADQVEVLAALRAKRRRRAHRSRRDASGTRSRIASSPNQVDQGGRRSPVASRLSSATNCTGTRRVVPLAGGRNASTNAIAVTRPGLNSAIAGSNEPAPL